MRLLFLLGLLTCLCSPAFGASVFRQRYNSGMPTLGGCSGGLYPNDNATYPLGACWAGNTTSVWFNDCWNNGLGSATIFNGSTTCNASYAQSSFIFATTRNGQPYCNVDTNPVMYNTFTCTDYTTPVVTATAPTQYITITNYPMPSATNCSGNSTQLNITVGQCASLGNGTYVIANCANGMVTASVYNTSDCSVQYDMNGAINVSLSPFGPYSQMGAPSAAGKAIGAVGSDCANTSQAFLQFTCFPTNITLPTTPIPTTAAPTTTAPTGPTTAAPTGPTTAAPTGPTTPVPSGNGTSSTGPTTAPTTKAPTNATLSSSSSSSSSSSTSQTPGSSSSSTGSNTGAASHHAQATWLWAICISAMVGVAQAIY